MYVLVMNVSFDCGLYDPSDDCYSCSEVQSCSHQNDPDQEFCCSLRVALVVLAVHSGCSLMGETDGSSAESLEEAHFA